LPDGLPEAVRTLLTELRGLKEESGYDLRALERKTHASRSSWGRWLSGETWIPVDAVGALADLCGADRRRLEILWEVADQARRPPSVPAPSAPASSGAASSGAEPSSGVEPPHGAGRRGRLAFIGAVVGCTLVAGTAGVALGATLQGASSDGGGRQSASSGGVARPQVPVITRREAMARTLAWHPHGRRRVPYDQTASYQGYRTDGSGYASMVLGLPKPGPNSALLEASYCRHIRRSALRPGDLVIKASGGADVREVLIFEKWTSGRHTAYWAYQQRRGYGTDHLVTSEGLAANSGHHGCRPYNVREDPVG
jgi:hypothetical protein